ncbi:MAG: hypothetical protein ACRDQU_01085 [Pseudonocardiaceae bacterium]
MADDTTKWYQRSDKDGDTHYGYITEYMIKDSADPNDGIVVTARCGLMFRPQRPLFDDNPLFGRDSVDALQACPTCRSTSEQQPDTDGAAVLGLIHTLSSPPGRRKGKPE